MQQTAVKTFNLERALKGKFYFPQPQTRPKISIVIINYNTAGLLRQCIRSIYRNRPASNYELIVVDNCSTDESVEMVEDDFSEIILLKSKINAGFTQAVNRGVKKSKGEYVLLLNPDITILDQAIEKMAAHLDQHRDIAVLAPQLINPSGSIQNSCFSKFHTPEIILYRRTFLGRRTSRGQQTIEKFTLADWDHQHGREVAWVLGSSMMVRQRAIKEVGLMDERFFMYMEDVDWCRRFWQNNWKVYYYPEVQMVHYYQRASASESGLLLSIFNRQTRIHIKSATKFFLKYLGQDEYPNQIQSKNKNPSEN